MPQHLTMYNHCILIEIKIKVVLGLISHKKYKDLEICRGRFFKVQLKSHPHLTSLKKNRKYLNLKITTKNLLQKAAGDTI